MSCLNPLDPQTIRVFSDEGAFHSCTANSGGGQDRCSVLQFAPQRRVVCYENHAQDSRIRLLADDCCPTIGASHAASPDHTPLVHQGSICYDGYNQTSHIELCFTLRSTTGGGMKCRK